MTETESPEPSPEPTSDPEPESSATPAAPQPATTPPPDDAGVDEALDDAVDEARRDLADDLGVPESEIELELAEAVVWPDASLGCPEPGTSYTQGRVPGSRIVLKAKGAAYSYHGVKGGVPVVCDQPQVPPPIR